MAVPNALLGGFGAGFNAGNDMMQQGLETRRQNEFARLASQAYQTAPDQQQALLGQMAAVNPAGAQAQQGQFQQQDDRRKAQLVNASRYLDRAFKSGDQAAIQGAYRAVKPAFQQLDPSRQLPEDADDSMLPMLHQILATADGGVGGTNVQSTYIDGDGNRVAIMRDGTTQILGANDAGATQQTITINGPDGRPAQYTFDRRTGNYAPAGGSTGAPQAQSYGAPQAAAPQAQAQPQASGQHFATLTGLAGEFPGVQMTSGMRTAQRNEEVGGAANSQHVRGTAADYAVPQHLKPAFMSRARQLGYQPIDEGDHIHLQLPRGGGAAAGGSQFVGLSKAEEADRVSRAQNQANLDYLPAMEGVKTQAAITQAAGIDSAKASIAKRGDMPQAQAALADANSNLDRLAEQARVMMNHPGLEGVAGIRGSIPDIPGSKAANARAEFDTLKSQVGFGVLQAMRAASKTGGALGAVSDAENKMLQSNLSALSNSQSAESLRQNLAKVVDYVEGSKSRMSQAYQAQYGSAGENLDHIPRMSESTSQAPRVAQRARNPQTGEMLELRNGQWMPAQ